MSTAKQLLMLSGLLCCHLCFSPALAQTESGVETRDGTDADSILIADQPSLYLSLDPADVTTEGLPLNSQLILRLKIVSRDPFEALSVDFPNIPDAEQIELALPRTRKVTSYAGEGYVYERNVAVFPKRPGVWQLPQVSVRGQVLSSNGKISDFALSEAGQPIMVHLPPVEFQEAWWMAASKVEIQEHWSIPPGQITEGDIVTRTIELTAQGMTAEQLPELVHGRTNGITVRELDSNRQTRKSGQGVTGTVSRTWSLKIDGSGVVYVSPVGVTYWSTSENKTKTAAVAGHRLEPVPADSAQIAKQLMEESASDLRFVRVELLLITLLCLSPLLLLLVCLCYAVMPRWKDWKFSNAFQNREGDLEAYNEWRAWVPVDWQTNQLLCALNKQMQSQLFAHSKSAIRRKHILQASMRAIRQTRIALIKQRLCYFLIEIFVQRSLL